MEPLFADLYKEGFTDSIATRLKNPYLIGEIFGMLFFGFLIDKIGRRTGVVFATLFLVLGIVLATAAHGYSELGRMSLYGQLYGFLLTLDSVLDDACRQRYRGLWCVEPFTRNALADKLMQ